MDETPETYVVSLIEPFSSTHLLKPSLLVWVILLVLRDM
jgi:hypothetical protein